VTAGPEQDCDRCSSILERAGARRGLNIVRVTHLSSHEANVLSMPQTFVYGDEGPQIVRYEADAAELVDVLAGDDGGGLTLRPVKRPN
jgi:hypothetical protein